MGRSYLGISYIPVSIEGRIVTLMSDHKPLVNAFKSSNVPKSDGQQRHLSLISEYISDMVYIKGNNNIVADCMSRPALAVKIDLCDLPQIASEQESDPETLEFKSKLPGYKLYDGK